jgi:hypothetical protein
MENFTWAQNNLGIDTPHHLQDRGVQVYFAPNIPSNVKIVNLDRGTVTSFHDGEDRTPEGNYYAEFNSLERFAREENLDFVESNGIVEVG